MFRRVFFTQWYWARLGLLPVTVAAFTIPVLSVQSFSDASATSWQLRFLLSQESTWSSAYPLMAASLGLLLGLTAWSADHRAGHVYALSLPVERWRFTLFRAVAGLVLLILPVAALWLGSLVAGAAAQVPVELNVYPHSLAARFLLASLLAFAVFFAVASGTARTAGAILLVVVGVGLLELFSGLFGLGIDVIGPVLDSMREWPGPLEVFGGRWVLIDY